MQNLLVILCLHKALIKHLEQRLIYWEQELETTRTSYLHLSEIERLEGPVGNTRPKRARKGGALNSKKLPEPDQAFLGFATSAAKLRVQMFEKVNRLKYSNVVEESCVCFCFVFSRCFK